MQSVQDIREKARAHGIKMNALCREAGIQQPQVSRWMSGTVKPLWASVNQLEQALLKLIEQKSPV
jgi:predicted transcriptional regulator